MAFLHDVFYEELGAGGQAGCVTARGLAGYLARPDTRLSECFAGPAGPRNRRAFMQFAAQQAGLQSVLPNGKEVERVRVPLLLRILGECFDIRL